jgi:hypothetical protein
MCSVRGLVRIDLSDNTFGEEAGVRLAAAIAQQVGPLLCRIVDLIFIVVNFIPVYTVYQDNLLHLNLRDAGLKGDAVPAVLEAIGRTARRLTFLDLSGQSTTYQLLRLSVFHLIDEIIIMHAFLFL